MLDSKDYETDFEIANKYIEFSSELLKISLTAISAIGALIIFEAKDGHGFYDLKPIKPLLFATVCLFGLTIVACLFHRFYASDFMSYHIKYLRTNKAEEKKGRTKCLKLASKSLVAAEFLFGGAVLCFAVTIYKFLI